MGIDVSKLPNQLLGLNYVRQIQKHNYDIGVATIKRTANDFSATQDQATLSSTEINYWSSSRNDARIFEQTKVVIGLIIFHI